MIWEISFFFFFLLSLSSERDVSSSLTEKREDTCLFDYYAGAASVPR
jgi:hypothetical protein